MSDSTPSDYNSGEERAKSAERPHDNGGGRVPHCSSNSVPQTDTLPFSPEQDKEFNLDDEILSALDNPDICKLKCLPNGQSVNSKQSVAENITSSEESDDDSEEEEAFKSSMGYIPLPQDSDEEPDDDDNDFVMVSMEDVGKDSSHQQCDMRQDDQCGAGSQDKGGGAATKPSELQKEEVEEIKQAMSGFSLPMTAVPEWAKHVPEDVWKTELMQGLHGKPVKK